MDTNALNERAVTALAALPLEEKTYCLGLAKHFERLGIGGEQASDALCRIIERGAISAIR